jgi:hypothetical protein
MTAVEGTQTKAIFGGVVSIEIVVSLVADMENGYSG